MPTHDSGELQAPNLNPKTFYEYTLSQIVNKTNDEFSWEMPELLEPKTPIEYYLSFLASSAPPRVSLASAK